MTENTQQQTGCTLWKIVKYLKSLNVDYNINMFFCTPASFHSQISDDSKLVIHANVCVNGCPSLCLNSVTD